MNVDNNNNNNNNNNKNRRVDLVYPKIYPLEYLF